MCVFTCVYRECMYTHSMCVTFVSTENMSTERMILCVHSMDTYIRLQRMRVHCMCVSYQGGTDLGLGSLYEET